MQEHKYGKLYDSEHESRKELNYPPFGSLIAIMLRGTDIEPLVEAASELKGRLVFELSGCLILGPAPPPVERVESQYRRRLLLKMPPRNVRLNKEVKKVVKEAVRELERRYKRVNIRFIVDVDPVDV